MSFIDQANWFCVAQISTGEIVYCGQSESFCADALEPGHVFVTGHSEAQVRAAIVREINRWRGAAA